MPEFQGPHPLVCDRWLMDDEAEHSTVHSSRIANVTRAADGVLITRSFDSGREPPEAYRAYDASGVPVSADLAPFAQSIAGSAITMQQPSLMNRLDQAAVIPDRLE